MNISSIIVVPHPDHIESVRKHLRGIDGVDLHAVSPEGRMVITIEADNDRATTGTYEHIAQLEGVMSVAMVYHQTESDPEGEISVGASPPGDVATIQR